MGTTANASFTSHKSTSSVDHLINDNNLCVAVIGAVVNQPGSWACPVYPLILAFIFKFFSSAYF